MKVKGIEVKLHRTLVYYYGSECIVTDVNSNKEEVYIMDLDTDDNYTLSFDLFEEVCETGVVHLPMEY